MAKKKTVRKTTKKKTTARSASGAVPSPAVVAKKVKKLRKKPAKKATRRAGAGGDAGVGKAILKESGRLAKQALAERIRSSRFQFGPTPTPSGMKLHASFAWGIARRFVNSST